MHHTQRYEKWQVGSVKEVMIVILGFRGESPAWEPHS